ncbi:MAG TPA: TaqI-like C-terminal specificity domain-containing protein [Candidatus Hydrogenedentes bacterium]|nr:TaqI-like C-terminal specificity domain-containing protein [Candidatus Hydrogenedentota bacterium]
MAVPVEIFEALQKVRDQNSFVQGLLCETLGWPVSGLIEDVSYSWSTEELNAQDLKNKLVDGLVWQIQPFVSNQPWGIFILEFKEPDVFLTGRGITGILRKVLQGLVPNRRKAACLASWNQENLLFIVNYQYQHFRFAYFKAPQGDLKSAPLASFGWTHGDLHIRTLCEYNLPSLVYTENEGDDSGKWVKNWSQAFDVERVTKEFFREYRQVFEKIETGLSGVPEGDKRRLYTQRLFNRLMFLYFIQKKDWLSYKGRKDYLRALYESGLSIPAQGYSFGISAMGKTTQHTSKILRRDAQATPDPLRRDAQATSDPLRRDAQATSDPLSTEAQATQEDFLNDRLYPLFFNGLNLRREELSEADQKRVEEQCGHVPYLNGGLFSIADEYDERGKVRIPNHLLGMVLDLFDRYNFTVTESTPLNVEVAVDPEMLGKVFEELITGRHETGSYYTPRPVVSFMCREALKGYLANVTKAPMDAIAAMVDQHDVTGLSASNAHKILGALDKLKAVDPACGSGAYLLGLLHEMIDLYQLLYSEKLVRDARSLYELKLKIITNCLYGVDSDDFAVGIARLRLWLSLAVDSDAPLPLPNLDFKIEIGDSLLGPDPSGGQEPDLHRHQLINRFDFLKADFLKARKESEKEKLKAEIDRIRSEIAGHSQAGDIQRGFDWRVEFAEVFCSDLPMRTLCGEFTFVNDAQDQQELLEHNPDARVSGFDIVLANPPYVRQELLRDIKPALRKGYPEIYTGTADLYCYFYARALQLLRPGGMLAFISSNKWFRAAYGANLREHIAETCHVVSITDFGELPVFESAATFPMVFIAQYKSHRGLPSSLLSSLPILGQNNNSGLSIPGQDDVLDPLGTDAQATIEKRQGAFLPHWTREGGIYAVSFRLADSLPKHVYEAWLEERDRLLQKMKADGEGLQPSQARRLHKIHAEKVEKYLDEGHGACYLLKPEIAKIVADALCFFDGQRYWLHAWCVMPNHVHAVVQPIDEVKLSQIMHSWKSFTANEANKKMKHKGPFWQQESYDHLIRDEQDYLHAIDYALTNPENAGLKNWPWRSSLPRSLPILGQEKSSSLPIPGQENSSSLSIPGQDKPLNPSTPVKSLGKDAQATIFTQVKSLDPPYPDVLALVKKCGQPLPPSALAGPNWTMASATVADRFKKMQQNGIPLGEYVNGQIFYGIKTGFNKAFVIDGAKRNELIGRDPKSEEIIKPLAVGDDIRKWHIRHNDRWLIVTKIGTDIKRYPSILSHLKRFQKDLEVRQDQGNHWWELRACAYYDAFDRDKIILPDIAKSSRFAFDVNGTYVGNTAYIIPKVDLYLLGVLNSTHVWDYAKTTFACLGDPTKGGRFRFIYQSLIQIPIPVVDINNRGKIENLVKSCLDTKGVGCEDWEREIDERVAPLYGL